MPLLRSYVLYVFVFATDMSLLRSCFGFAGEAVRRGALECARETQAVAKELVDISPLQGLLWLTDALVSAGCNGSWGMSPLWGFSL